MLRAARNSAGLTQAETASRAGTSQATVAAYEAGRKSPRLATLERMAGALGCRLALELAPVQVAERRERDPSQMSRSDRRSLWLHRAIAVRIQADPHAAVALARHNQAIVRHADRLGHNGRWGDKWDRLLDGPLDLLLAELTSTSQYASQLRQTAPFAGLLTPRQRWAIYRDFEGQP